MKFEINAYSTEEAKTVAKDQYNISVVKNMTQSYVKSGLSVDNFIASVTPKLNLNSGEGIVLVLDYGTPDNRERPYEFVNTIPVGTLTKKRMFDLYNEYGQVIASFEKKGDAIRAGKNMMKEVKGTITCKISYHVNPEREVAFTLNYDPSSRTHLGSYVVFTV